jgi:hypothetical protein
VCSIHVVQSLPATFLAREFEGSNANRSINRSLPPRYLLWFSKLTVGDESISIRRDMDVGMTVESPDVLAFHNGGCTRNEFRNRGIPTDEI